MYLHQAKRVVTFAQISMAAIYLLFGALKFLGGSPAEDLILSSITFLNMDWFYPFLGGWELVIGLTFLHLPTFKKVGFFLFMAHMGGTFLPFLTSPELCVDVCDLGIHRPTLTMAGQYIIKNLSLIAVGFFLYFISKKKQTGIL